MTTITAWSLFGYPIGADLAAAIMMLGGCIAPLVPPVMVVHRRRYPNDTRGRHERGAR